MITALVTFYNPVKENVENVKAIAKQVDRVFVCDNSKVDNSIMFSECPKSIIYIPYKENLGLSRAFNGILKKEDYWNREDDNWVIFFDQDSKIENGHIEKLIEEFLHIRAKGINIGCLGPIYYDTNSEKIEVPRAKHRVTEKSYIVSSIITSSMLTTYKTLKEIDFWNEKLFLDMADWDLCWRLKRSRKDCCVTKKITLQHTLGLGEKKIGFITLKVTNPIREYYQIRDCLYLKRENYIPFKYKVRFILMVYLRSYLHVKYLDHGEERRKYIERAKEDFKRKIRGEFIPD